MAKKKVFFILAIIIILFFSFLIEKDIVNKIIYPRGYSQYVERYSEEFGLDVNLVYSIIKVESKFRTGAMSRKGAKGLMQISDITREWAKKEMNLGDIDIFDPEVNIKIGCWYLNKLYKEFGDLNLVVAAYNGGSGNVNKWLKDYRYSKDGKSLDLIPFKETSLYVKKITKSYKMYNDLYSKEG